MRSKLSKIALTAALGLALAFTFSCGDHSWDELLNNSSSSNGNEHESSPSVGGGCPNAVTSSNTLSCGGQTYKIVVIGSQIWMAENLNYNVSSSKCYAEGVSGVSADSIAKNCAKYGRFYDWKTATEACPKGWHLPSDADWNVLMKFLDPSCSDNSNCRVANKLKATSGWRGNRNGTDDYGFSALPGGGTCQDYICPNGGGFGGINNDAIWWTSTGNGANAGYRSIGDLNPDIIGYNFKSKTFMQSVRCVQDDGSGNVTPTYSIDGVWETSYGRRVTVSGSTGVISVVGSLTDPQGIALWQSAIDKGIIKLGSSLYWRNITKKENSTWSGQEMTLLYETSKPNVAVDYGGWINRTFTMSADGQTLTSVRDDNKSNVSTWTRKQ
jgi:uncharacterized protein (TIGR02145 family)